VRAQVTLFFILNSVGRFQLHIPSEEQMRQLANTKCRHWQSLARELIRQNIFEDFADALFTIDE